MYFRDLRFLLNYLTSLLGVALLTKLFEFFSGLHSGFAATLSLPLLIAAMIEGQHYAQTHRSRPPVKRCCVVALTMTALVGAVAFVALLLLSVWQGQLAWPEANWLTIAAAVFALLRIGYAIGLASELKGQQVSSLQTT